MQATARMASVVSSALPARRRLIRSVRPTTTPLIMPEPHHFRRWKRAGTSEPIPVYTCGRPGRSLGSKGAVSDSTVKLWLRGLQTKLPQQRPLAILSLLGTKPDGTDEHSFYSFRTSDGFVEWLGQNAPFDVTLEHFATVDFQSVPRSLADSVGLAFEREQQAGRSVLILDSGGEQRTGAVCRMIGLTEDPRTLPEEP